jgi:hypothetical protein
VRARKAIVDTNVAVVANGGEEADPNCVRACVRALRELTSGGHVVVDDGLEIMREYRNNLRAQGQPGVGDAFFKWLWDNLYVKEVCTRVPLTEHPNRGYSEFPEHEKLAGFDPSDRKFVAVAAAHPEHPPILQAADSKWWGFRRAFSQCGIKVEFVCPSQIASMYGKKMKAR